jgi:hypothetical protein
MRFAVVTPIAFSLPLFTCGSAVAVLLKEDLRLAGNRVGERWTVPL